MPFPAAVQAVATNVPGGQTLHGAQVPDAGTSMPEGQTQLTIDEVRDSMRGGVHVQVTYLLHTSGFGRMILRAGEAKLRNNSQPVASIPVSVQKRKINPY